MSIGEAIGTITDRVVTPVSGMHQAIASQWLRPFGAYGGSARRTQDATIALVYGSIRFAGRMAGLGIDRFASPRPQLADRVDSVIAGLWDTEGASMSLRDRSGRPLDVATWGTTPVAQATGHMVVLVHGLVETEQCFGTVDDAPSLLDEIEQHPDLTPLLVRYRSGSRISESGAQLAVLLEEIHAGWPVPVESMSLVGHSMGGLVIRSACVVADERASAWLDVVTDVVMIATPHRGSPIEKLANLATSGLDISSVTRPLAQFLDARSSGIKDLRFGSVSSPGPGDGEGGGDRVRKSVAPTPLPSGIRHHFVGGSVTANPAHLVGAAVGDLVVRQSSSTGGPDLAPTTRLVVGGVTHQSMLQNPVVIDRTMGWVTPTTDASPA